MLMKERLKLLWDLFSVFFKIGICTFGGGIAMLPILQRELADKRGWTDENELLDYFAIGQSTPGIIAVNVATFIGFKKAGVVGGCVATFGMVFPSIIIITLIAMFLSNFADIVWVKKAMSGINVAVAAILTSAVYKFAKKSVKGIFGLILLLASFVLIFLFNVNTIWIILGSALLGVVIAACRGDFKKSAVKNQNETSEAK
ncbi:chromate transporter [Treponema zioleckii]|uniref:chromate transporter n=1 Tax=Treponema zioleckii TaxID=331680 RepID=UPI003BF49ED6